LEPSMSGKDFEKTWRDEWEQHARIVAGAK
jgi:hypothetical protein